ncbi:ISAs1 family transposase [Klebsiella sp. BIGb0407]|uniref:ISAs1 family transposase n=1 Tax=Klebsiella sp. BIGb0407 TaxID=2940603 RepID=UPI0038F6793A|nr:hypothetical protein [Klebsiella sp. BIGb0407]
MKECHTVDEDVIVNDGKTLRRSYDKCRRCIVIHVVNAFSIMIGFTPGKLKTAEKSNEKTVMFELLKILNLKGKIVKTDAMGCQ